MRRFASASIRDHLSLSSPHERRSGGALATGIDSGLDRGIRRENTGNSMK